MKPGVVTEDECSRFFFAVGLWFFTPNLTLMTPHTQKRQIPSAVQCVFLSSSFLFEETWGKLFFCHYLSSYFLFTYNFCLRSFFFFFFLSYFYSTHLIDNLINSRICNSLPKSLGLFTCSVPTFFFLSRTPSERLLLWSLGGCWVQAKSNHLSDW